MKVVDIHPEELIDKLQAGELSGAERERLDAHLAQCSACRFEIDVRADLAEEAQPFAERPQLTFAGQAPVPRVATQENGAPRASGSVRPRVRRRWPLVMLAAALVLCAGGATAAVVTGTVVAPSWLHWSPELKAVSGARPVAGLKSAPTAKHVVKAVSPSAATLLPAVTAVVEAELAAAPSATPTLSLTEAAPPAPSPVVRPVHEAVPALAAAVVTPEPASAAFPSVGPEAMESGKAPPADAAPQLSPAASLFADANRARRDGNMDRAVALYQALQTGFPGSAESELSRALVAQMLLERGSPDAALAGFDRYLAQGTPVLSAEALVGRARALEQLGKSAEAVAAWQEVQRRFPGSVHARLAATRLVALGSR